MRQGSSLAKARGLGSAHHGTGHWLVQRITAIANLILFVAMAWLVVSLLGEPHLSVASRLQNPLWALVAALFVVNTHYHAALGLQVVIEDYVGRPGWRFAGIILVRFALIALAGLALFGLLANFTAAR